jgi:hypothetical protein
MSNSAFTGNTSVDLSAYLTSSTAASTYQPLATVLTNTTASFTTADETKLDFITVTQAVNLDTIESDTATNNAKVTNATHTGDATGSGALTVVRINGVSLAGLATGILKNTTGTGVPSIAVAGDFPTLNQNTTGSAATLTTPRTIGGVSFNGSANIVPQTIESANEASDTTCFPLFITASGTQSLQPKNNTSFTFNSSTGALGATSFSGASTGLTGTAASLTAGNVTTNANLTGHITSTGNAAVLGSFTFAQLNTAVNDANVANAAQTFCITGKIGTVADQDYDLAIEMPFAGTITKVSTKSTTGTCTATFKVNTTALGGTANSVSSTQNDQTHGSSNTFASGDDIRVTISSNSACANISFTIVYTRTLA